jgi:hypothetical protein
LEIIKNICIFEFFLKLSGCALPMQGTHIGFAKWRVSCFYDSLVQGSNSVFQMNICAENPPLRKAENR